MRPTPAVREGGVGWGQDGWRLSDRIRFHAVGSSEGRLNSPPQSQATTGRPDARASSIRAPAIFARNWRLCLTSALDMPPNPPRTPSTVASMPFQYRMPLSYHDALAKSLEVSVDHISRASRYWVPSLAKPDEFIS